MRLCLAISSLAAGGAERVLTQLADHWVDAGHDVLLLTTHDRGGAPHYRTDARVRLASVDPLRGAPLRHPLLVRSLRRAISRERPDVVISFLNYTNIFVLTACRGLGIPVIVSERLDPRVIGIGRSWEVLRRLTYRHAARLVAQTSTAGALYEHLAPGRLVVIPNPVAAPRGAAGMPDGWPEPPASTVIAVGRLQHQKGFDLALRAFKNLSPEFPAWRFIILGEGPLRGELEQLREDLGLADRVFMPGRVPDPEPWLRQADIFLMSSRSEGFPNALAEAMAVGLPVVSTDCPSGPADLVTNGHDGLLVRPDDAEELARGLRALMVSAELRQRLGSEAVRVVERFSPPAVFAAWDKLVADVAAGSDCNNKP